MTTQPRKRWTVFAVLALGAMLGAWFGFAQRDQLAADDATRTTSLSLTTHDFGSGSEAAAIAVLSSSNGADTSWVIHVHVTPYGGSEARVGGVETAKADGHSGANCRISTASLASGSTVRAEFLAYDTNGTQIFSFGRTVTTP